MKVAALPQMIWAMPAGRGMKAVGESLFSRIVSPFHRKGGRGDRETGEQAVLCTNGDRLRM